jgi:hypothetical protein
VASTSVRKSQGRLVEALGANPALIKIAVVVWSFAWTYQVGHIGMFAFDQSQVFDGGWRILSGQVPYKDFLLAYGPMTFAVQALFFKLFGVNWTSLVVAAALMGVAAALSAMRTVRLLFGERHVWLIGLTGLLVGTSFQSIFGTLSIESTAFFWAMLGIQAVCESLRRQGLARHLLFGLAGALSVLSFLSKQNVGGLSFLLLGFLVVLAGLPGPIETVRSLTAFLIGVIATAGLFWVWLVLFSNPHLFLRHAVEVPSEVGRGRIKLKSILFLPDLLGGAVRTTQWCLAVALAAAFQSIVLLFTSRDFRHAFFSDGRLRTAAGLALAVPFFERLFQISTLNQPEIVIFLSGFALSLGTGLFLLLPAPPGNRRVWIPALACFIACFLLFEMIFDSWNRTVHDVFPRNALDISRRLHVPKLAGIRWITPTKRGRWESSELHPEEIDAVCAYLASRKQDFFVLGDSSYLYGVNGVVPPQPLLYFQKNHYFTRDDVPRLDRWIIASLKQRDIRLIVREKENFMGDFPFPNTLDWIRNAFHAGPVFGNFEILER